MDMVSKLIIRNLTTYIYLSSYERTNVRVNNVMPTDAVFFMLISYFSVVIGRSMQEKILHYSILNGVVG